MRPGRRRARRSPRRSADSARGTGRGRPTPGPFAESGGRCTRTARIGSSRWAGRPARCRRPPPAARRGRNCRRRKRSTALSRRPISACHSCQASKSRSAPGDAAAVLVEDVQIFAARAGRGEELGPRSTCRSGSTAATPSRTSAGRSRRGSASRRASTCRRGCRGALLLQAGLGELQAELRLADAGRADHGGQRARQQSAAHRSSSPSMPVESRALTVMFGFG